MSEGERIELEEQTQQGEHNVLDEDKMVGNHMDGSLDIENVLRMECSKINFSLTFFSLFLFSPLHGGTLQLVFCCCHCCTTGNHTGCDLLEDTGKWSPQAHMMSHGLF